MSVAGRKPRIAWEPIRLEYIKGIKPAQLADKYGVPKDQISNTAYRKGWKETADKFAESIIRSAERSIEEKSQRFVNQMTENVLCKLDRYCQPDFDPQSLKDMVLYETGMEKLNGRARKTFGLDQQVGAAQHTTVNVRVLSDSAAIQVNTQQQPTVAVDSVIQPQIEEKSEKAKPD